MSAEGWRVDWWKPKGGTLGCSQTEVCDTHLKMKAVVYYVVMPFCNFLKLS
jgi:hypothetical protein